jgi:hypothetical protein
MKWILLGGAVGALLLAMRRPRAADLGAETYRGLPVQTLGDGTRVAVRSDGTRITLLDPLTIYGDPS